MKIFSDSSLKTSGLKWRKYHRFLAVAAIIATPPFCVILVTGVLLQIKAFVPWIQPPAISIENPGPPQISWAELLVAAQVPTWREIRSIDVRPEKGVARIRTRDESEITVDLSTGKVLQSAPRRTGMITQLHEGTFFGKPTKYGLYLPTALLLLCLWITGIYLWVSTRRKSKT